MSAYDRSQGVADSAPDAYADAGPAAFGKSYSADRAIQDARGDEGEARSSTRKSSPKVGIPAFLHLIIQSQAGCQAC